MPQYLSPGVYVEEVDSGVRPIEGVGTAVAAFIGLTASGPLNTPTQVSNWTEFVRRFTDADELARVDDLHKRGAISEDEAKERRSRLHLDPFVPGAYLPHAVYGYFANGGGNAYIIRVGSDGLNGEQAGELPAAYAELSAESGADKESPYRIVSRTPGMAGNDLSVDVTHPEPPADAGEGQSAPTDVFDLVVRRNGEVVEHFQNLTTRRGKQNAATVVNEQSKLIRLEELVTGSALERPASGAAELSGGAAPAIPDDLGSDDFIGDVSARTGASGLETIEEIAMVCAPDLSSAYERQLIDLEQFQAVQLAMITHCELMGDRMAILDPPPNLDAQQIRDWRVSAANYDSKYATLYWPRLVVADPSTGRMMKVPPSGHVAGIWARNDAERGVHKAPANEVVRGAVDLELLITTREQELLNPAGINCIRAFPGRGIRVWGARTLSTSNPEWRYVNVRRLFNYLEKSILANTDWVVFEPNDRALWAKIRRTIASFLVLEWRRGALFGSTPSEAFFVKCDDETNPAEAIGAGQVICMVGVAPVKPAEFVVFQLAQLQGGVSLVTE